MGYSLPSRLLDFFRQYTKDQFYSVAFVWTRKGVMMREENLIPGLTDSV